MQWTAEQHETLRTMVAAGASNAAIGEVLGGRLAPAINQRKIRLGLIFRRTECLACGGHVVQAAHGSPRRFCTDDCWVEYRRTRGKALRAEARAALIAARVDWACAGCANPIPRDDPRARFCSARCRIRASEARYAADGRRQAQKDRFLEKQKLEASLRPAPVRVEVADVIRALDDAGQPNDFGGKQARAWVRGVGGLSVTTEKVCAAVRVRRARGC